MDQYFQEAIAEFIQSQSKYLRDEVKGKDRRSRRWLRSIISFALSVWISSPHAYRLLSNIFFFPTKRLLQRYKNCLNKEPGINHDLINWMYVECKRTNSPLAGGIIFYEIHLQPGIQLQKEGEGLKLFGYANQGENHNGLSNCLNGGNGLQIATTVLQFVSRVQWVPLPIFVCTLQWHIYWRTDIIIMGYNQYSEILWPQNSLHLHGQCFNKSLTS